MDRLASMTVFTRVVEVKSFTTAAKLLGISRAMASKHVQDLEHHLSIRLLNRTTRTLSLTDAGATFYDRCRQILESVQTAEEEAASQSLTATGKLRVAAPMSFGVGYVFNRVALRNGNEELVAQIEPLHQGPSVLVSASF